ncbi:hypothetical protein MTO96_042603, partial [Rhipicephalus appendiculatus]
GMPIYTGLHELPDDKRSALGKRLDLVQQIVRPNASRFSPYTNVIFLHDLVHGLQENLQANLRLRHASLGGCRAEGLGGRCPYGQRRSRATAARGTSLSPAF